MLAGIRKRQRPEVAETTRKYSLPGHPEPDRYDVLQSAPLDGRPSQLIRRQISVTGVYMDRQGRLNVDDLVSEEMTFRMLIDGQLRDGAATLEGSIWRSLPGSRIRTHGAMRRQRRAADRVDHLHKGPTFHRLDQTETPFQEETR
jgi:hypothetical protein